MNVLKDGCNSKEGNSGKSNEMEQSLTGSFVWTWNADAVLL
jgi:hypothetical protein